MKKIYLIICSIITINSFSYADIDFRSDYISYQKYEQKNSETILKFSLGLYNDIQSKMDVRYYSCLSKYEWKQTGSYWDWNYIGSDYSNGSKNISYNNNCLIYDLAIEYRYYIYDFIAIGGGISMPLKKIETFSNVNVYTTNPYLSFKIKNFLENVEILNNFYILFNLGTFVPFDHFSGIDTMKLGFDIGVGYEYKKFIFELSYSKYSMKLGSVHYYKYNYYSTYPDSTHRNDFSYDEYNYGKEDVNISRFKLTIGYKF